VLCTLFLFDCDAVNFLPNRSPLRSSLCSELSVFLPLKTLKTRKLVVRHYASHSKKIINSYSYFDCDAVSFLPNRSSFVCSFVFDVYIARFIVSLGKSFSRQCKVWILAVCFFYLSIVRFLGHGNVKKVIRKVCFFEVYIAQIILYTRKV
jgi:hypothetical protein